MSKQDTLCWLLVGSFALIASGCGGDEGGGDGAGGADGGAGSDGGGTEECPANQQDEDGDGVCNPDCASTDCGNGTCAIDGAGLAVCTCDAGFRGDSCDALDAPSAGKVDFWIDANEGIATGGSNVLEAWVDRSGNANNGLPEVVAEAPTLVPNTLNGLPVVRFDGDDDHLDFENMEAFSNNNYTVFVVARPDEGNNGELYYASDVGDGIVSAGYTSSAIIHYHEVGFVGGDAELSVDDYGGEGYKNDEFQIYTFRVTNNDVAGWINGNNMYGESLDGPDDLGDVDLFTLAANNGGGNNFDGDIAELIIISDDLHYGERKPIEDYLAAKWFGKAFERTPSAFGAAHVWLDASQADTLTDTNDGVSAWINLGIGAGHFDNGAFPASRPELVADGLGGLPVVRFGGGDALLQNTVNIRSGGEEGQYTVIAVMVPPAAGEEQIVFRADDANDDERVLEAKYSPDSTAFNFVYRWPSSDTGGDLVTGSANSAEPMIAILERAQSGNFYTAIDGVTNMTAGSEGGITAGDNLNWSLGGESPAAPGDGLEGDVAEFIVLTTELGAAEEAALTEMLSAKWGLE